MLFLQILRTKGWKNTASHRNECRSTAEVLRARRVLQDHRRWMRGTSYYLPINRRDCNYIHLYFKVAGDKHKHNFVPRKCKQCTNMGS
jgi:hypothetical protein